MRRFCRAQQHIQGVDLPAAHMLERAAVDVGAHNLLHIAAGIERDILIRSGGLKLFFPLAQGLQLTLVIGQIAVTRNKVGIDIVFLNPFANDSCTKVRDFKQRLQPLFTHMFFHRFDVVTNAGHDLAAVAAGAAVA